MNGQTTRLLIIDDDPGDVRLIQEYLRDAARTATYLFTTAARLDDALRLLARQEFDVILLDLNLPDSQGLNTVKALGAIAVTTPVIVTTGLADEAMAIDALRVGAQDYLVKNRLNTDGVARAVRYAIERTAIRNELSAHEAQYRLLAENISDLVVLHAPDSTIRYATPSCIEMLGYLPEEMIGKKTDAFFHPDDLHILNAVREQSRHTLTQYTIIYRAVHKDGSWRWFETKGKVIRNAETQLVVETITVSRDITRRYQADEYIRLMHNATEQTEDAVVIVNAQTYVPETPFVFANPAFQRVTGYSADDILSDQQTLIKSFFPDPEIYKAIIETVAQGNAYEGEIMSRRKDGAEFFADWRITPVRDATDTITHIVCIARDIAERWQGQQALAQLAAIVESSGDAIVGKSLDGVIQTWNGGAERLYGYSAEEAIGHSVQMLSAPENPDEVPRILSRLRQGQRVEPYETVRLTKTGQRVDISLTVSPIFNSKGVIIGASSIARDISERKRAEQRLIEERSLLRTLIDNLPDYIYVKDSQSRMLISNNAHAALLGVASTEETLGKTDYDFFPVEEAARFFSEEQTAMQTGKALLRLEHPVTDQSTGQQKWLETSKVPLRDNGGQVIGIVGISRDITARKLTEENLRRYNQRIELLHQIDQAILSAQHPQLIAEVVAQTLKEMLPCDAIRIIVLEPPQHSLDYLASLPPVNSESRILLEQVLQDYGVPEALRQGQGQQIDDIQAWATPWEGYKEILSRGGMRSWILVPLTAVKELLGFVAVGASNPSAFTSEHLDITREVADQLAIALHRAQLDEKIQENTRMLEFRVAERTEQLHATKERIEAILSSASDAIVVAHMDGGIEQANPAFLALFGYHPLAQPETSLWSLIDAADRVTLTRALDRLVTSHSAARIEITCLQQDGTRFYAEAALARLDNGQGMDLICIIRDISTHKKAEESLRDALAHEKELNELQTSFTSIVSHEFRTPLSVILSSTDLLLRYSDRMDADRRTDKLITITHQVRRLIRLLDDVLMITRADVRGLEFKPNLINLISLCQEIIDEVTVGLEDGIKIEFIYSGACQQIRIDEFLFTHILQNLMTNAIKYSKPNTTVHVVLTCENMEVVLRVEDQGIGIPKEHQARLFEAFRRASNVGQIKGTGIGLTIVKRSVEAHGGRIEFESTEGQGTTFVVTLPVNDS